MGVLFSRAPKKSRITDTDRSILTLKLQRDQLNIVRNKLVKQHEQSDISVRKLLSEEKKGLALIALKHKKHQGELLHRSEEYLLQVNQIISNVEMASIQNDVVRALETGKSALASIQSELSLNYVEKLLEENAELSTEVKEVSSLLAGIKEDDEPLYEEYLKLEARVVQEKADALPNVPHEALPEKARPIQNVQASRELSADELLEVS